MAPLAEALTALKTRAVSWYQREEARRRDEARQREEADRRQREAEAARLREEAAQLAQAGQAIAAQDRLREVEQVVEAPPPPPPPSSVPTVKGLSHREHWTYAIADKRAFVEAVAGLDRVRTLLSAAIARCQSDAPEALALLQLEADIAAIAPTIPLEAVQENAVYVRGRAKTDRNTLRWPGVRIYDAGSAAVRG